MGVPPWLWKPPSEISGSLKKDAKNTRFYQFPTVKNPSKTIELGPTAREIIWNHCGLRFQAGQRSRLWLVSFSQPCSWCALPACWWLSSKLRSGATATTATEQRIGYPNHWCLCSTMFCYVLLQNLQLYILYIYINNIYIFPQLCTIVLKCSDFWYMLRTPFDCHVLRIASIASICQGGAYHHQCHHRKRQFCGVGTPDLHSLCVFFFRNRFGSQSWGNNINV